MAIKATEVGRIIPVGTAFDLSGFTNLRVRLTDPSGVKTEISSPRVSAPGVSIDTTLGTFEANTYMQFTTTATDFPIAGNWKLCAVYEDSTPKEFHGSDFAFTVDPAC